MIEYYFYFFLLWTLAFLEFFIREKRIFLLSIVVFFFFLALRVDTGYDWPVYQRVFESISSFSNFTEIRNISSSFSQEVGFVFLLAILKSISSEFQIVIITISIIETFALYKFLELTSKSPSMVLAIVGTWLLFTLYFSVLRQGLAVAFFFLFFIYMHHKFYIRSILMMIFSLSVQMSSLAYFLLYWLGSFKIKRSLILFMFICSLIGGYFSKQITLTLFYLIHNSGLPIIAEKAIWYMEGRETVVNIYDKIFVYTYSTVMFYFLYSTWNSYKNTIWIRISFIAVLFIFIQLLFIDYPLIRNRIQYIAFSMQFVLIINYFYNETIYIKFIIATILFVTVFTYFTMMLNRSYSIVFVPYQDYIRYKLFDFKSTGEERQEEMFLIKSNKAL